MKLLIIDDQVDVTHSLKEAIEPGGHECILYNNPQEALEHFKQNHFDAVVTDLKMPEMTGISLLRSIQESKPETPVVILTGYADVTNSIEAVNLGAYAFYQKPLNLKQFLNTLTEIECKLSKDTQKQIEINRLNQDKEVLSTEMKFRINTNLQIICSLLRLQSNRIKDPHSKRIIDSAYQRIHTIDMIQDRIYHLDNPSHINLAEFIQAYVRSLYYVYQIHENDITIDSDCKPVCVVAGSAIYWGLIVHELLSNAVEHPFQNTKQKNNKIKIALKRLESNQVQLSVKDNGKGLPNKFDLHSLETMGLNLVINIAEHHLKGLVSIQKNKGTCFTVAANG